MNKNYLSSESRGWRYEASDYKRETYKDPDFCATEGSKELYSDLLAFILAQQDAMGIAPFGMPELHLKTKNRCYYRLASELHGGCVNYGSDYIGPSRSWAQGFERYDGSWEPGAGYTDLQTGELLVWARTIGGHVLWPSSPGLSINYKRGGGTTCDRIDIALAELRNWMLDSQSSFMFHSELRAAIESQRQWFEGFKPHPDCSSEEWFATFLRFFMLEGYVTEGYEVMNLAASPTEATAERHGILLGTKDSVGCGAKKETIEHFARYAANQEQVIRARTIAIEALIQGEMI